VSYTFNLSCGGDSDNENFYETDSSDESDSDLGSSDDDSIPKSESLSPQSRSLTPSLPHSLAVSRSLSLAPTLSPSPLPNSLSNFPAILPPPLYNYLTFVDFMFGEKNPKKRPKPTMQKQEKKKNSAYKNLDTKGKWNFTRSLNALGQVGELTCMPLHMCTPTNKC